MTSYNTIINCVLIGIGGILLFILHVGVYAIGNSMFGEDGGPACLFGMFVTDIIVFAAICAYINWERSL